MEDEKRIIVCVPGPWEGKSAFVRAVAQASMHSEDYAAAGMVMMHGPSKAAFEFDFCDRDEDMTRAFASAGLANGLGKDVIEKIDSHKSVVYLLSTAPQTKETSISIAKAAAHLVKAGGLGVKIETAGKAFSADQWLERTSGGFVEIYELMVLDSVTDGTTTYSCGMRNLGLWDAIVSGDEFQSAVKLLRGFNMYQLYESPELLAGQTFGLEAGAPRYRLSVETQQPDAEHNLHTNPFGMWRLSRVLAH
ncbi:hypothetical protein [Mesorhizobium sp. B4-1-4]|uniref:hypothetical protein n=1 Tax=Mesorhizobium sp. B4-1-4 TaxID=2589888 RepID=UPI00112BC47C|nr:hypothetical protein [Mesorhizobium sp. B4-1-4]UCI30707.1 hypothetical protein FJW03_23345 [Mesorhizobium sp. B4-1-4]